MERSSKEKMGATAEEFESPSETTSSATDVMV